MDEYGCAAVILTAVEIETQSIRNLFDGWKPVPSPDEGQSYYKTTFTRDGKEHTLITAQQKVMGMTAATLLATKAVYTFKPRYLCMCGIAAGVGEESKQMYGDVIVPDLIWDYSTGKFVGSDESEIRFGDVGFLPRPVSVKLDPELKEIVSSTQNDPENEFHVHLGPMACGSSVVANAEVVEKRIRSLFPHTVGLDMESYAIYYVAESCPRPRPKAIVIKSICDFADSSKSDQYQKFAAYTSSGYLRYLLENKLPLL